MDNSGGYEHNAFVAEFYDYVEPYRARQDVAFFVEMAQKSNGPVLEMGCGTGRILIPTAKAGIEIVGLDASQPMLSICRTKLAEESQEVQDRVELVQADMRQFDLGRQFGLITIPFRPFQHLITFEEQRSCLRSVHRHLRDAGRFILDIFNPSLDHLTDDDKLSEFGDEPEFTMPDGRKVIRRHRVRSRDLLNQLIDSEIIHYVTYPDGRKERLVHRFPFRYFFRFEAEHLLVRCSLAVEEMYSDFDKSPYGSKYPGELIILAKKA